MEEQQSEQDQLAELEAKCEEYLGGWKRAMADYENLRKDTARQVQEASAISQMRLVAQVLPLYDYFKLAVEHIPPDQQKLDWVRGIMHINKAWQDWLKNSAVEPIMTEGQEFNPEIHEAIAEEESALPGGQIVREVQAGYTIKGKVIVPAKVIISKQK